MNVVFAGLVFVGGIHFLHIQLTIGNGWVTIFTGGYRRVGMQSMTCQAAYPFMNPSWSAIITCTRHIESIWGMALHT
jgi:hypothetical protein